MIKKISTLDAQKELGQLIENVRDQGDQYVIEQNGEPMAAVVPVWQLDEWQKRRMRFFGMVEDVWDRNKREKLGPLEEEVSEAIQAVRTKKRRRKA